jgi:CNT family concentrative nucleoside transporter
MKRVYLLITLLTISFSSFSQSQSIIGIWNFKSILPDTIKKGKNLKAISEGDIMKINEDGSFHYEIAKENLIANGTWELRDKNLYLHYSIPKERTRIYEIKNSEKTLVLNENEINFLFEKETKSANNGFSVNKLLRGLLGIISLLLIAIAFSRNRKRIEWQLVWKGLLIQIVFAVLILKVPFIQKAFEWLSSVFVIILGFTREGSLFLFGDLVNYRFFWLYFCLPSIANHFIFLSINKPIILLWYSTKNCLWLCAFYEKNLKTFWI